MQRWLWLVTMLAGCGRLGFELSGGGGSGDGGTVADSPLADALEAAIPCPSTIALEDDFADAFRGPEWSTTQNIGITVSEVPGSLRIDYSGATPANQFGGYNAVAGVDVTRACVTARLRTPPGQNGYAYLTWGTLNVNDKLELEVDQTWIGWWYETNSVAMNLPSAEWNMAPTAYLRLQRANGEFTLEISNDGVQFYVLGRTSVVPFDLSNANVRLGGGNGDGPPGDGRIEWTDVSVVVP